MSSLNSFVILKIMLIYFILKLVFHQWLLLSLMITSVLLRILLPKCLLILCLFVKKYCGGNNTFDLTTFIYETLFPVKCQKFIEFPHFLNGNRISFLAFALKEIKYYIMITWMLTVKKLRLRIAERPSPAKTFHPIIFVFRKTND